MGWKSINASTLWSCTAAASLMAKMKEGLMPPEKESQAAGVPGDYQLLKTLAGHFVNGMGPGDSDMSTMSLLPSACSFPFQEARARTNCCDEYKYNFTQRYCDKESQPFREDLSHKCFPKP